MSGSLWWDEPVARELILVVATRRELLARLVALSDSELAAAAVRIDAAVISGKEALARLTAAEALARDEQRPGAEPRSPAPETTEWRPLLRLTNQVIANEIGLSFDTIKSHVAVILKKVGAADRAQLAYRYVKLEESHRLGLTPRAALQGRSTARLRAERQGAAARRDGAPEA